jgi:pimeloyl-ACP methyl ester carboxylesterase
LLLLLLILPTALLASEQPKAHSSAAGAFRAQAAPTVKDGFVLFPGGHQADGVEWQPVVASLSLPALAMAMPHGATANMTRDDYITSVLSAMDRAGFKRAILVGHSGGGLIVPQIAIKAPDRVRHMVFVAANVPPEGGTVMDVVAFDPVAIVTWGMLGPKYQLFWWWERRTLCSDCDDQTWALVKGHFDITWNQLYVFSPNPAALEHVTRRGLSPSIPRTFIKLLRDGAFPLRLQDKAAADIGAEVVTLDSGHMAPLTHPKELAVILNRIAAADMKR